MKTKIVDKNCLLGGLEPIAKQGIFPAGTPIYHQGQPVRSIYVIDRGYVRLAAVNRSGDERTRAILGRGAIFGASIEGDATSPTDAGAYALGPVRAYSVARQQLRDWAMLQPQLGWCLIEQLSTAASALERRVQMLCHKPVEGRLAGLLYELLLQYGARCRHGHDMDIRLSHQDLADMIGASRPVVSSVLAELRRRGVIAYTRRFICVDDAEALHRLAED